MSSSARRLAGATILLCLPLLHGACDDAGEITVPTVYLIAGQVADPTTNPFLGISGATVRVVTAPEVEAVTTDAGGNFVLHGVPLGVHRLRAEHPGHRATLTIGIDVSANVDDAGIPLFTDAQVDSILSSRGAPPWDRATALFGAFARRSTGLPLASAAITFAPRAPHAGGTLVQTGVAEDPIVVVNAMPGEYQVTFSLAGFAWDVPYDAGLEAGTITFGAPRARPNLSGFVFADRSTGSPVDGATVSVYAGPPIGAVTTDFLGQFSLIGVMPATYVIEIAPPGLLPTLSWPDFVDVDTTRNFVVFHADSVSNWVGAAGGPMLSAAAGHLAVEARSAAGGALLLGATLEVGSASGFPLAQTPLAPAMRVNLDPGEYEVRVLHAGNELARRANISVRAGRVSFVRLDL